MGGLCGYQGGEGEKNRRQWGERERRAASSRARLSPSLLCHVGWHMTDLMTQYYEEDTEGLLAKNLPFRRSPLTETEEKSMLKKTERKQDPL